MKSKKKQRFALKYAEGMLVDKHQNVVKFYLIDAEAKVLWLACFWETFSLVLLGWCFKINQLQRNIENFPVLTW
ncbi:MAG: hypothetical protein K2J00_06340 [Bacteroidaceae bacterium]|nr:hypothetical protein [Bacteroidaceae bacterium]